MPIHKYLTSGCSYYGKLLPLYLHSIDNRRLCVFGQYRELNTWSINSIRFSNITYLKHCHETELLTEFQHYINQSNDNCQTHKPANPYYSTISYCTATHYTNFLSRVLRYHITRDKSHGHHGNSLSDTQNDTVCLLYDIFQLWATADSYFHSRSHRSPSGSPRMLAEFARSTRYVSLPVFGVTGVTVIWLQTCCHHPYRGESALDRSPFII